jgi:hypothetical protein
MKTGQNGAGYKREQTRATQVASGDTFGFYERLRPASQRRKRIVANGIAKNGNQRMRCEIGELSGRVVRSRSQGKGNLLGTDATNSLGRAERVLVATAKEYPLRDASLNIGFDPLVNDVDHLLANVREVVEAGQFERLERSLRAPCKVVEHGLRSFHIQPPVFTEVAQEK